MNWRERAEARGVGERARISFQRILDEEDNETPSDRVLSSWLDHAREAWVVEKYSGYPQRVILNVPYTDMELWAHTWIGGYARFCP